MWFEVRKENLDFAQRAPVMQVTRASVPFAKAQVESFEFTDTGNATRVRWTLALEPRLLAHLGVPFAPRVITRLFHRAMQNLAVYVRQPA